MTPGDSGRAGAGKPSGQRPAQEKKNEFRLRAEFGLHPQKNDFKLEVITKPANRVLEFEPPNGTPGFVIIAHIHVSGKTVPKTLKKVKSYNAKKKKRKKKITLRAGHCTENVKHEVL